MNKKFKKQVKLAKKAISEMGLRKIKNINRRKTAYGLKHVLEDYLMSNTDRHRYISEGACIQAMIDFGFDKYVDKYNWTYFNVGQREITTVISKVRQRERDRLSEQ